MVNSGYSDCTVRITYAAKMDSSKDLVIGDSGNDNMVVLTWKRSSQNYYDTLVDDCHVFSYGIDLTKLFSDGKGDFSKVEFLMYDHNQHVIFVCRGMGAEDIFRSVSKELAHAEIAGMHENYNRNDAAFKAYSASYLLCKNYQIGTADYNFSRLPASFRESSPQQVRETLTEIRDTANQISTRMYRALEQNRAPKAKEQER